MASLINSISIVVVAVVILVESIIRLLEPVSDPINATIVIWLAGVAILVNGLSAYLLHSGSKHSMNMRSAFLHLISDTLFSLAVLIGGLMILYYDVFWIDSVLSILIALYLIYTAFPLIKRCVKIIMQFAPQSIDLERIKVQVEKMEGVKNIHHVHIWELDEHDIHFEGHVEMNEELTLKQVCEVLRKIETLLKEEHQIAHITLQPESGRCESSDFIHKH